MIAASPMGKVKMAAEVIAILLLILGGGQDLPILLTPGRLALWVAVFAAVVSGVDYYRRFSHVVAGRDAPAPPAPRSPVQRDQVTNVHRVH